MNWIIVTVFAAFFQNLRSGIQKNLNKEISLVASTYVRFIFCLPFAFILYILYFQGFDVFYETLQQKNFLLFILLASIAQIFLLFYYYIRFNFLILLLEQL